VSDVSIFGTSVPNIDLKWTSTFWGELSFFNTFLLHS
jgi:hypothetical protein